MTPRGVTKQLRLNPIWCNSSEPSLCSLYKPLESWALKRIWRNRTSSAFGTVVANRRELRRFPLQYAFLHLQQLRFLQEGGKARMHSKQGSSAPTQPLQPTSRRCGHALTIIDILYNEFQSCFKWNSSKVHYYFHHPPRSDPLKQAKLPKARNSIKCLHLGKDSMSP